MSAGEDTNARNPPQHASEAIIAGDRFDRGRWLMARDRNGDIAIVSPPPDGRRTALEWQDRRRHFLFAASRADGCGLSGVVVPRQIGGPARQRTAPDVALFRSKRTPPVGRKHARRHSC
jgi:hypothetical protein